VTNEVPHPFDRSTLRERCTSFVREQIIIGELRPGEHIKESELSRTMGVSRGTLRESLRPLEAEGLVVNDGRGHSHVRQLSSKEILDVFEVREALEILAATKLAERDDRAASAADLRGRLDPLASGGLSFARQIEIDLAFHARICELTGSETLLVSWSRLIGQIEMMIIAAGPRRAADRMRRQEHVAIADAIETGDRDHVARVVSAHMTEFAQKYVGDALADEIRAP